MIEEDINSFLELRAKIDELTKQKDILADKIKQALVSEPNNKYVSKTGIKVTLVSSTTFKYTDENAIINYLNKQGTAGMYITKKLDTTKLNKELRLEGSLYENVKAFVNKITTESLKVTD